MNLKVLNIDDELADEENESKYLKNITKVNFIGLPNKTTILKS